MSLDDASIILVIGLGSMLLLLIGLYLGRREVNQFKAVNEKIFYVTYSPRRAHIHYYFIFALAFPVFVYLKGNILLIAGFILLDGLLISEVAYQNKKVILTDHTIILTTGFIARDVISVNYADIKVVQLKENELGRILRYADLMLDVVGAKDTIIFKSVRRPLRLKQDIEKKREEHISRLERRSDH